MSFSIRYLCAALLALWVVGCGDSEAESREAEMEALAERHGINADVTLDEDGSVGSVTISSSYGAVGNSLDLPDGFPTDVPISAGWNVMAVSQVPQGGFMLQAMSESSQQAAIAEIREAMQDDGWSEEGFKQPAPHMSQLAFGKGDRMANVNVMQLGEAQLTIQLATMLKPDQG